MLSNKLKATILRYCDLSYKSLVELKQWAKRSASFNSFPPENFASPSLRVAVATNSDGETVCMTPIETVFLASTFLVNPLATQAEALAAGDEIDRQLSMEAQRVGASALLIMVPASNPKFRGKEWSDFKTMRVYERKFPNTVGTGGITLGKSNSTATNLIN